MAAAVWWRFGSSVTLEMVGGLCADLRRHGGGAGLIWQMVYVRTGALLLHVGLFAALLLLWRDPATGARLGTMIAARRDVLRAQ